MSCWTSVAAVIRLDTVCFSDYKLQQIRKKVRETLGKEVHWGSSNEIWEDAENRPEKYLPFGSEGSLEMVIHTNPDKSSVAAFTVTIFGDLRDRGYSEEDLRENYIEWFKKRLNQLNEFVGIRQATITVTNGYDTLNYTYTED